MTTRPDNDVAVVRFAANYPLATAQALENQAWATIQRLGKVLAEGRMGVWRHGRDWSGSSRSEPTWKKALILISDLQEVAKMLRVAGEREATEDSR